MQTKTLLILFTSALVLTGCSLLPANNQTMMPENNQTSTSTQSTDQGMTENQGAMNESNEGAMEDESKELPAGMADEGNQAAVDYSLDLKNYSFTPNKMTASPGQTLRVKLTNVGGLHDFVIDELNVRSNRLSTGDSQIVEIKIPQDAAGKSYEFYCSVANHRALGMKGTLEVTNQ